MELVAVIVSVTVATLLSRLEFYFDFSISN